ncbi:conjugal transfer mating-pair stabilization protein TraG [Photobacterium sp. R1]
MTLDIYNYTNGDVAQVILNAIATFFYTESFSSLIQISAMFGVLATCCHFYIKKDVNSIPKWAAVYVGVPLFCVSTKVGVQIIDLTDPSGNYQVANVPAVLAVPAHIGTTYMYGVTKTIEDIFHSPNDQAYGKSGMLFGSKLYQLSRQSQIDDSSLRGQWLHYMQSCIIDDIQLNGKYTWQQLSDSPNIFQFLKDHSPSPLRSIEMGPENFVTCKDALPKIESEFTKKASNAIRLIARMTFSNVSPDDSTKIQSGLHDSYKTYYGISKSASDITSQNMAINALRNGLSDGAALNNNTAAAINYAYTQNKMQTTSMWAGMALQAREFLPMMQSILFLLLLCMSVLVIPLAMIPSMTKIVLANFFKGFIYLGTWPILFSLINFIMTTRLSLSTNGLTDIYGGITLSNIDPVAEMHSRTATMTGFLMMSVPVIVGIFVKGVSTLMGSAYHQFAGMMNSVNSRTSASVASGDVNLGNGQVDNFSFNNMNGNKMDTSALMRDKGVSIQNETGGLTTTFNNGHQVMDGSAAISRGLGFDLNSKEGITKSLRTAARDSVSQAENHRTAFNQSLDNGFDQLTQFSNNESKNLSYGDTTSNRESAQASQAASTMNSTVKDYAKLHSISEEEAYSKLSSVYYGASGGVGVNFGLFGASGKIGLEGGIKQSHDLKTSESESSSEQEKQSIQLQNQFNKSASIIENYDTTDSSSDTSSKNDSALMSISDNFRNTRSLSASVSSDLNQARTFDRAADNVQDASNSVNFNLMPDFQKYVMEQNPDHYQGIMYGSTEEFREQRAGYISQFLEDPEVLAKLEKYSDPSLPQSKNEILSEYERNVPNMGLTSSQNDAVDLAKDEFDRQHWGNSLILNQEVGSSDYFKQEDFDQLRNDHDDAMKETKQKVIDASLSTNEVPDLSKDSRHQDDDTQGNTKNHLDEIGKYLPHGRYS